MPPAIGTSTIVAKILISHKSIQTVFFPLLNFLRMSLRRFMERNVSVHSSAVSRANPTAEKFLKACEDGNLTMVKKMVEKKEVAINESDSNVTKQNLVLEKKMFSHEM